MYHRLLHLEESVKNLELIRFDLSTRNAELQEKVVRVQEQNKELQKRPVEEQDITRVEDLASQLDDANKQIMKLKAQQKTKVKNLNRQLDELKKVKIQASVEITLEYGNHVHVTNMEFIYWLCVSHLFYICYCSSFIIAIF
jgi:predicted RNase H-like nuclease (RuvC/YqgF family)